MLGAVLSYGELLAPLQKAWATEAQREPTRLRSRFGTPVTALKPRPGGVEVDAGIAEVFDLTVVAEGGIFAGERVSTLVPEQRPALRRDYQQTAWVGTVDLEGVAAGVAFERFTRDGPLALLPLRPGADGQARAALVWCVPRDDDPVAGLNDAQRLAVLASVLPQEAGRPVAIGALKGFALGLSAERTLVHGRMVRIGNAAQTLHPVAGQGLNLGLRDAFALVHALRSAGAIDAALRRVEWSRAADRWSVIAATDFLARGFTWRGPGLAAARALALAALQTAAPLKSALAREMMFGMR
jgi:2-octaprenyl-6-methoxyphenol hydroxylase